MITPREIAERCVYLRQQLIEAGASEFRERMRNSASEAPDLHVLFNRHSGELTRLTATLEEILQLLESLALRFEAGRP